MRRWLLELALRVLGPDYDAPGWRDVVGATLIGAGSLVLAILIMLGLAWSISP